jgi:putative endonuclease
MTDREIKTIIQSFKGEMNENLLRLYYVQSRRDIYTGVTRYIWYRVFCHKRKLIPGFTKKYNVTRLVCYEETRYIIDVLNREKQIKGWNRVK